MILEITILCFLNLRYPLATYEEATIKEGEVAFINALEHLAKSKCHNTTH